MKAETARKNRKDYVDKYTAKVLSDIYDAIAVTSKGGFRCHNFSFDSYNRDTTDVPFIITTLKKDGYAVERDISIQEEYDGLSINWD